MSSVGDQLEAVRTVMGASRTAMVLLDGDGVFTEVNDAGERLLGWSRADLVGRHVLDTVPPADRDAVGRNVARVLAGEGPFTGTRPWMRADGTVQEIEFCLTHDVVDAKALGVYMPELVEGEGADAHERRMPTPRELQIIRLLVLGRTGQEIADELHLSPLTVRTHVRNAMERLGAQTRAHLIAIAIRDGLVVV